MKLEDAAQDASGMQSYMYVWDAQHERTVYVIAGVSRDPDGVFVHPHRTIVVLPTNFRHVVINEYDTWSELVDDLDALAESDKWQVGDTFNTEIGMFAAIFTRQLDNNVIYNRRDPWEV